MDKGKLIVFEGVDGSGKSHVSKLVAESLGAQHIESPLDEFQQVRKYVNANTPQKGQLFFYLATNLDLSNYLEKTVQEKEVVCARYYHSSIVDYSARQDISSNALMEQYSISDSDFFQPDLTILLYVNQDEQRNRINKRNRGVNTASDKLCLENDEYRTKITGKYLKIANERSWNVIDTSNMSIDAVVAESLRIISDSQ